MGSFWDARARENPAYFVDNTLDYAAPDLDAFWARGPATLDALLAAAGPRLRLIHANDSKDECGSTRDRHERIGAGRIGAAAFAELLTHPATAGLPVIVETPTEQHEGHAADIALLKDLREA